MSSSISPKTLFTLAAPLMAGAALGLTHLVASLTNPSASPLLTVGAFIIELTPTPVKTWAVANLGTADKPILIASVALVTLALLAILGRRAAPSFLGLASAVLTFSALPLFLTLLIAEPSFSNLAPSLLLPLIAGSLLFALVKWLREPGDEAALTHSSARSASRRAVLVASGLTGLVGVASALAGEAIRSARLAIGSIRLPSPVEELPPKVSNFDGSVKGLTPLVTPVEDFYRVDINLSVPIVDHADWTLELKRKGYDTLRYSYDDLLAMDLVERDITLVCVSNSVGGRYAGSGRWLGVDLMKLLEPLEPDVGDVDQLFATSTDGYTSSSPLKYVTDGREGMVVVGYNGEVLSREHGFPARLLIPGLYGFIGATKWLSSLELTTYAEKEAYWTKRDWATDAPIRPMTRIDVPRALAQVEPDFVVAGVAWAGTLGVEKVEVALDGGAWQDAEIDVPEGPEKDWDYWVQWKLPISLDPGSHQVQARCVTKTGVPQDPARREPFPSGASGIQSLTFTVQD